MPRFYFDIRNSKGFLRDDIGDELESFEAAREQAQATFPDIVRQEMPDGEQNTIVISVRDETDCVVYEGELTYRGRRFPQQPA